MSVELMTGDCRELIAGLKPRSVNLCLTSPPYFNLRDYGTGTFEGGDPACDHVVGELRRDGGMRKLSLEYRGGGRSLEEMPKLKAKATCPKCGARRVDRQIGLEKTPEAYIAELVAVFQEVHRVLRDDGVLIVNIGDSYSSSGGMGKGGNKLRIGRSHSQRNVRPGKVHKGLKPKDLIGIPWMLAFALRSAGWYLRQEIIWHKPNPMPESVRDRCTKAHETVFLLAKSETYLWDSEAIAEQAAYQPPDSERDGPKRSSAERGELEGKWGGEAFRAIRETRNRRSVWTIATEPDESMLCLACESYFSTSKGLRKRRTAKDQYQYQCSQCGVWDNWQAHYAMMPTELARLGIMAGCPLGGMVLDPFAGAGTVGMVADRLQRNAVMIELNPASTLIAKGRLAADAGMFAS